MTRIVARFAAPVVFGVMALATPSTARADIIFNNLGPGNTFNVGNANPVGFDFFTGDQDDQGDSFFPLFNGSLSGLTIALKSFNTTNASPVTVLLATSTGGLPGSTIETWIITPGSLGAFGGAGGLVTLISIVHPSLAIGSQYWVTALGGATDAVAWNLSSLVDANPTATSVNGGTTWNKLGLTPGALRLDAAPITTLEPTSLTLTATAMLGMASYARRRRKR